MDATIAGALIATGGGLAGAFLGTVGTLLATRTSSRRSSGDVHVQIEAEREHLLWEREAAAYQEMLAVMMAVVQVRRHHTRIFRWDAETEAKLTKEIEAKQERIATYLDVDARFNLAAHDEARDAWRNFRDVMAQFDGAWAAVEAFRDDPIPDVQARRDAHSKREAAMAALDEALDEFIRVASSLLRRTVVLPPPPRRWRRREVTTATPPRQLTR